MTVLLLLSNADGICLIDAITTGGIAVLKKLYEFNRSDCESAIIQMIKYKISCHSSPGRLTPPSLHHASSHRRSQRAERPPEAERANRPKRSKRAERGGGALGGQNYTVAIAAFAITLLISGVGLLIYRRICAIHARRAENRQQEDKSHG